MNIKLKERRHEFFKAIFKDKFEKIEKKHSNLWSCDLYQTKVDLLTSLGFKDPHKIILILPEIIGFSSDNIEEKINSLKELGFNNPIKLISLCPDILVCSMYRFKQRMEELKKFGLNNPIKVIQSSPRIFRISKNRIQKSFDALKEIGFNDPSKIFFEVPLHSIDSIKQKIRVLEYLGIVDPINLIIKMPATLSLSICNIEKKIKYFNRSIPKIGAAELIKHCPIALSYSPERISLVMRILYDKKITLNLTNIIGCLTLPKRYVNEYELSQYPKISLIYKKYFSKKEME